MAVRRLELELEKVRLQLECERIALRRVELEQSSRPPSVSEGSDRRGAITDGIAQCAKVLKAYRLPCDADVPIWFEEVEKLFSSFQVPEHSRVHLIMPALAERVRYLLRGLNDEECTDYETVKKAVLDELKLTPAKYLERFEKASKRKEETWAQFASRARTYLAYYLQSRNANTKEAMTELMVADRMKASLSSGALEYVLLREGEDWFKPVEVAKVLETFEQAKGKGRATKPAATASLPQHAKLAGPQRTNLRCHVCHIQGHLARDCPKASDKEPQGKPPTVQKQRVQKVAVVSEEPPPEQERVLSARVHVVAQNASSGRSKLDLIPLMCGDIATEAVLDTGSEITVVRKSMLPIDLQEPSRTVRLESAFGNTIRAKLATLPVGMHRPGAVIQPQRIDLVCAVTDELANGVDCLLSKEDWELLRAQEKEEFGEENIPRSRSHLSRVARRLLHTAPATPSDKHRVQDVLADCATRVDAAAFAGGQDTGRSILAVSRYLCGQDTLCSLDLPYVHLCLDGSQYVAVNRLRGAAKARHEYEGIRHQSWPEWSTALVAAFGRLSYACGDSDQRCTNDARQVPRLDAAVVPSNASIERSAGCPASHRVSPPAPPQGMGSTRRLPLIL
ncbi:uncharacterized protein [Dermacentor albipictus]|uniref:uncharacterized protein n=1 Tax=Dermacentor albipictus TaxID=60249 RepID=UPI0038FCB9DC